MDSHDDEFDAFMGHDLEDFTGRVSSHDALFRSGPDSCLVGHRGLELR